MRDKDLINSIENGVDFVKVWHEQHRRVEYE